MKRRGFLSTLLLPFLPTPDLSWETDGTLRFTTHVFYPRPIEYIVIWITVDK